MKLKRRGLVLFCEQWRRFRNALLSREFLFNASRLPFTGRLKRSDCRQSPFAANEMKRRDESGAPRVQTQDHRYGGKACPPTFSGKRAYQEGAGFVVADELSADLFRRRLRVAPVTRTPAVDVFGLAIAPSFLLAICSIPSFGNREIRRQRLPPRYQQNTSKRSAAAGASANFY